jgi:transcriptional regulator CtsR
VLVCLCRLIDSDDFENDRELEARVMEDDFQCGQCQICYVISQRPNPAKDPDTDDS